MSRLCWRTSGSIDSATSRTASSTSVGHDDRRDVRDDPDRLEDGVDEAVQALDLRERRVVPGGPLGASFRVTRVATLERRVVGEQLRVGPHDRQWGPEFVGDERDQLAAGLVDPAKVGNARLGLDLLAALLDDAREQVGDGPQLGHVAGREVTRLLGLDVEHADDLVVPAERDREHRGDEPPLVDPADPEETLLGRDVGHDERLAGRRDEAGHALAVRNPGPADLVAIQAVGGRERQVGSIPIEQVQGGDVRVERVAGPVDDGLEQLVPRPGRRRKARDVVEEAQLVELLCLAGSRGDVAFRGGHQGHDTSVGAESLAKGCGRVEREMRNGGPRTSSRAAA